MAGPDEGLSRYTYFANEEANDIVDVTPGAPYGPDPAVAPQRQAGYAVVLDARSGHFTQVTGMGRLNHENSIVVPNRARHDNDSRDNSSDSDSSDDSSGRRGWRHHVVLTTDDTFSGPSAQLYMYLARRESDIWNDNGDLWAFRVTGTEDGPVDPEDAFNDANDYLDLKSGDDWQGEFIRVPDDIADGRTGDAPQTALEEWSNDNNVFQFIRLEDMAYDRHHTRTIYIADTGRTRVIPDPATGRMQRGPSGTDGFADNGRIFKMVLNKNNPREVDSFSILADADDPSIPEFVAMINPDNMDTSKKSLMVQEDHDDARIWRYDFHSEDWSVVATVNDPDGESSGIVDASRWFGKGWWMLDVQAHGIRVDEEEHDGITFKREAGQLLLMKIPGS